MHSIDKSLCEISKIPFTVLTITRTMSIISGYEGDNNMNDFSYLDRNYFIDSTVYNCPFCNRRNIRYEVIGAGWFHWTVKKECYITIVKCSFCKNRSLHLSFECLTGQTENHVYMHDNKDIDSKIFYSVPTSFFVLDDRIPRTIRELITEAEGCLKMNFLTGASACTRKAIYELLAIEKPNGTDYYTRIKNLKKKHPDIDPNYFDILAHIQGMTSDKIHEQSWPKWDSRILTLILETLKSILHEIFVLPNIKAERSKTIQQLQAIIKRNKKKPKQTSNDES